MATLDVHTWQTFTLSPSGQPNLSNFIREMTQKTTEDYSVQITWPLSRNHTVTKFRFRYTDRKGGSSKNIIVLVTRDQSELAASSPVYT